tara:strand:- start:57 stop:557 length:501 start_codon:yes stop_codon:yes gene_type:complete
MGGGGNVDVLHVISLSAVLLGTWLLLSGYFTTLLISFGILSLAIAVGISLRMDVIDHESHPIHLTWRIPTYWLWLLIEIVKSNINVTKTILGIGKTATPTIIIVKPSQRTALGQVIYANSITLTPGTISVELENDEIMVHALTKGSADDLSTGMMDRRVARMEEVD